MVELVKKEVNEVVKYDYNKDGFEYKVVATYLDNKLVKLEISVYKEGYVLGNMSNNEGRFNMSLNSMDNNIVHVDIFNAIFEELSTKVKELEEQ